jgi:Domain of unknown function (DUF4129)
VRALLLATLLLLPAAAAAETLPVDVYRGRLLALEGQIRSGDWIGARTGARELLADRIAYGRETLEPDRSVLRPLAEAPDVATARAAATRLARLAAELAAAAPTAAPGGDAALLKDVRGRQAVAELPEGGALPKKRTTLLETIGEILEPFAKWLKEAWESFRDWLESFFPDEEKPTPLGMSPTQISVAAVILFALLGAWLAWRAFRNRRRGTAAVEVSAPTPPAADDDPLSRGATEWERYAAELAAAGRFREAVRAWYHAVLVTLFRRGALHYRKGRTNWEYVGALAPGHAWRSHFVELTRCFEREWYGRDSSTPESLREAEDVARGLLGSLREAA